jgi:hypothetical protein
MDVSPHFSFWLKHMMIWRLLLNRWVTWIGMLTLLAHGILLGAGYFDGRPLLPYLLVCAVWIYGLLDNASQRAHRLDPYPIPRRTLFLHVTVTSLVVFLVGLGVGIQGDAVEDPRGPMLIYKGRQVEVPAEFREIAWGGRPPIFSSPWGESHTPKVYRLLPWSEVALFNPYESGEGNSAEFVALQAARAAEVVHGIPVPSTYRTAGFQLDEQRRELIESCCFPVEGSKGRGSDTRSRTYAIITLLIGLVGVVMFDLALRRYSKTLRGTLFRWIPLGTLIAIGVLVTLAIAIQALGFSRSWAVEAFFMVLARQLAEAVPIATPALWGIVLVAFVGFGLILLRRFERIEANPANAEKPVIEEY